ncbi:MAG: hypothetical protein M1820_002382 [Bogoriella megaspora]|nr:MAG: hypothetical protein M1820_002382 [Bogoriella megaspora]
MPPQFSSRSYWNARFTEDQSCFDWLLSASSTSSLLPSLLSSLHQQNPQILHIGCGSSWLSFHLRELVEHPSQILNLDFSEKAVVFGRRNERELYPEDGESATQEWRRDEAALLAGVASMHWATADLLCFKSLIAAVGSGKPRFSLIVDKSTSDAIACAESMKVSDVISGINAVFLDSEICVEVSSLHEKASGSNEGLIDPMIVLALHLAAVTDEGGKWLAVSYSTDRFWFLENCSADAGSDLVLKGTHEMEARSGPEDQTGNSLDPKRFWRLESETNVDPEQSSEPRNSGVHRPRIQHWVYTVTRTEIPFPSTFNQYR